MNICFLSTEYPPDTHWGGIGTHVHDLARGLAAQGHDVVVVARALAEEKVCRQEGVTVYRVVPLGLSRWPLVWRIHRIWDSYNLAVALKLIGIVRRHRIQVIEAPESRAEAFFAVYLRWLYRCRLVIKLHSGTYLTWRDNERSFTFRDRLMVFMEKRSVRRADLVVSPSQALIDRYREPGGYLARDQPAEVLRNGIDLSLFTQPPATKPTGCDQTILYVGRLEPRKGVPALFQVVGPICDRFPEVTWLFIGEDQGLKAPFLEDLEPRFRKRVRFIDFLARAEIAAYYRRALCCVFPSRWENFPYTCLEAMAAGAAVIGSRSGGMAEMIEEGASGLLVSPNAPAELEKAIASLVEDSDLRERMGAKARERVARSFSREVVLRQTLERYRALLD